MTNDDSIDRARSWSIQCLLNWLKIREKEGRAFPASIEEFTADVDHSLLLRRLTQGKPPLEQAPPLSFGHPWYELVEKGKAVADDVCLSGDKVVINHQDWNLVATNGPEDYIVDYNGTGLFRVWVQLGSDPNGQSRKQWCIAKHSSQ